MYSGDELGSDLEAAATRPIYRLHVELLEMIFNIYVDWLIERYCSTQRFISCTHVCHTWREVALSSARLWRCIDLTRPKVAKAFLVRSKKTPICIMLSLYARPSYICRKILRQHAERIREIDVFLNLTDMNRFTTHLGFALPALSTLSLQVHNDESNVKFTCAMPNVRVVNLRGVALPWDTCTNLTKLSIQKLGIACSPSVSQILTIMMQCPALKFVHLSEIKPVIGAATILQTPIDLLHLQTLELGHLSDRIILHILSCISIPSFATLNILGSISSLASVIPRHSQRLHNLSCNEGSILRLEMTYWMIKLELCRPRPVARGSQIIVHVEISETSYTTLSSFAETIDLLRVVTLKIDGCDTKYTILALPHSFLAALTCLTTLEVGCAGSRFFAGMTQPQKTLHNDIICPQLKTVIIQDFMIWEGLYSLIVWSKERNQFGVRLHRLELNRCEVSQDMMDVLRSLVDEVIVRRR